MLRHQGQAPLKANKSNSISGHIYSYTKGVKAGTQISVHACLQRPDSQQPEDGSNPVPIDGQMDKQTWSLHTVAYHSALKRKGMLTPATTWRNLGDTE